MVEWFRFDGESWLDIQYSRDVTAEQWVTYINLISLCMRHKNSAKGYIAMDNNNPPKYAYDNNYLARLLGVKEELIDSTIKMAVRKGWMAIEPNGILRIIEWRFIYPIVKSNGYNDGFNKELKQKIRERDNHTCQRCGITEEEYNKEAKGKRGLMVHHIDYNKPHTEEPNLISLCVSCHTAVNTNRKYWTKVFQDKLTKFYGTVVEVE